MKLITIFLTPIIISIGFCAIINAAWPYYIITFCFGSGIGALAVLTWFQLKNNSDRPYIKLYLSKEKKSIKNNNHENRN